MKRFFAIRYWLPLVVLVGVALIVCLPLFNRGFFVSDDGGWMIVRLSAFYQSLREGQFPVRFLGRLNNGYGYPVANFLYPGFMYIGSVLHFLGLSFIDAVKVILGGSVISASLFTYLWLRQYFRGYASMLGAIGFVSAPYMLFDLYKRGSVGEVLAIAAASAVFLGVSSRKKWLVALATAILILSHNSLALLFLLVAILYAAVRKQLSALWLSFGVGIGMTTFFWFPALYERKYVVFDRIAVSDPLQFFVTGNNIALVGLAGVAGFVLSFFARVKHEKERRFFQFLFAMVTFLVLPMSAFIWNIDILGRLIQFPYRLLSVSLFAGAWLMAYGIEHLKKPFVILLSGLVLFIGVWMVTHAVTGVDRQDFEEGYYTTNEATTNVANEYMPRWVSTIPQTRAKQKLEFYSGHGIIVERIVNTQLIDVEIEADEESVIQINTLYYPGWGALLNGQRATIKYDNAMGLMRITIPAGNNHLIVNFRETISRFLADVISIGSIVMFIILLFA